MYTFSSSFFLFLYSLTKVGYFLIPDPLRPFFTMISISKRFFFIRPLFRVLLYIIMMMTMISIVIIMTFIVIVTNVIFIITVISIF